MKKTKTVPWPYYNIQSLNSTKLVLQPDILKMIFQNKTKYYSVLGVSSSTSKCGDDKVSLLAVSLSSFSYKNKAILTKPSKQNLN